MTKLMLATLLLLLGFAQARAETQVAHCEELALRITFPRASMAAAGCVATKEGVSGPDRVCRPIIEQWFRDAAKAKGHCLSRR
jgi:hypothetical protein